MEVKLFGKSIFEFRKEKSNLYWQNAQNNIQKSNFLIDFWTLSPNTAFNEFIAIQDTSGNLVAVSDKETKNVKLEEKRKIEITPKGVYEMKLLDEKTFKLNTNEEYIDEQIVNFKDKLNLMKVSESDFTRGLQEISSIIQRLENRKKYQKFEEFFKDFAYTTNAKINEIIKNHDYLKIDKVDNFMADMPKEAVEVMKNYNKKCSDLCQKKAIFYVIANKKDFQKVEKRRDPILLAQSPFGHIWQILGVWDEEMLIIDEL
jgi:hypothetical protein